jgi:hypothetical protein
LKNVAAAIAFVEQKNILDEHDLSVKSNEFKTQIAETSS